MKKFIQWIPLMIFLGLVLLLTRGLFLKEERIQRKTENLTPHFKLASLTEPGKFYTEKDIKGEWVLVNFWASWCVPCGREFPVLEKIREEYGIKWVGINYKDTSISANQWLEKLGNPYALLLADPQGNAGIYWGLVAVPETFLVDKQGVIRYKHQGPITLTNWENEIWPELCQISQNAFERCQS